MYSKQMTAGWADMDFNSHMRNTAYLDKAVDVRFMFLAEHGYPIGEFVRLKLGPVALKDELEYYSEIQLLQEFTVTLELAGMSPDGMRWRLRHEVLRSDGKICAKITSIGGWLDLAARKLIVPPEGLMATWKKLTPTTDYTELRAGS